jgi:hypothetical protein
MFLVIDSDRHRDDLHRLYKSKDQALDDAKAIVSKAEKRGYTIELMSDHELKDTPCIYFADWCGESYGVRIIEIKGFWDEDDQS